MASYNTLSMIVGEEKVVAYVHAGVLWDICGGDGDAAQSGTFIDVEVWSTSSAEHTNDLIFVWPCIIHINDINTN